MNTETTKLIEQLAQKLGTTTEYLWSVLIKQAAISAATDLLYLILVIIGLIVLIKLHFKFSIVKGDGWDNRSDYEKSDGLGIAMACIAVVLGGMFFVCFFSIGDIINGFVNPEYWALDKVLSSIKN